MTDKRHHNWHTDYRKQGTPASSDKLRRTNECNAYTGSNGKISHAIAFAQMRWAVCQRYL